MQPKVTLPRVEAVELVPLVIVEVVVTVLVDMPPPVGVVLKAGRQFGGLQPAVGIVPKALLLVDGQPRVGGAPGLADRGRTKGAAVLQVNDDVPPLTEEDELLRVAALPDDPRFVGRKGQIRQTALAAGRIHKV